MSSDGPLIVSFGVFGIRMGNPAYSSSSSTDAYFYTEQFRAGEVTQSFADAYGPALASISIADIAYRVVFSATLQFNTTALATAASSQLQANASAVTRAFYNACPSIDPYSLAMDSVSQSTTVRSAQALHCTFRVSLDESRAAFLGTAFS